MAIDEIVRVLPAEIRDAVNNLDIEYEKLQEIHLRVGRPLMLIYDNRELILNRKNHSIKNKNSTGAGQTYIMNAEDLQESMEYISNYSMYAFEEELRQGFITIQGGHRVGIAGKAVMQGNHVSGIRHVSFINIRLSHQIRGCADDVMRYIADKGKVFHTLIISPPKCGKTTLLRDIIRQLSDGKRSYNGVPEREGKNIAVVDERSELGACYQGVPQNDLGIRTDVLDCCPKAEGMMMMIRSMSPDVIAVDEIGSKADMEAIHHAINCGCVIIATVHGSNMDDVRKKPILGQLVTEKVFQRYIILTNEGHVGKVKEIFDERGNRQ
ncbi:MAG: stage III sporulation protein AA [Lachnoclostridium sp.]|jgi:stage III sporulation protein AA|nr:stage III sporulation protein AA [Lachnoclostridium sp.]